MEDERYQKELFEFEKKERPFRLRFGRIFARPDIAVTLSMEKIVFIGIGLVLLMVIVYALGVENGKRISPAQAAIKAAAPPPKSIVEPLTTKGPAPVQIKKDIVVRPAAVIETNNYTIVAATFKGKDTALSEIGRLKKQGFDAVLAQSDSYYIVCIGAYPDKESQASRKALNKIRQFYRKDAYFKTLQ